MTYIVVEEFNGELSLAIEDGETFQTEDLEEAIDLKSQLQGGYVLPLCDIIGLARSVVTSPEELNASKDIQFEMKILLGLKP